MFSTRGQISPQIRVYGDKYVPVSFFSIPLTKYLGGDIFTTQYFSKIVKPIYHINRMSCSPSNSSGA